MPVVKVGEQEFEVGESLYKMLTEKLEKLQSSEIIEEEFFTGSRKRARSDDGDNSEDFSRGSQSDRENISSQLNLEEGDPGRLSTLAKQFSGEGREAVGRISDQSAISGPQSIAASVVKDVLMRFEIEQGSIRIITNKQRPTTSLAGSSQGDHVTAYAALLQMICSVMDGEDVHGAPEMLYKAATCFIDEKEFSFEPDNSSFEQKQQQVEQQFFARDLRKKLTASIRIILHNSMGIDQINDPELKRALQLFSGKQDQAGIRITSDDVERLRDAIKRSNQTLFAQFAIAVGEQLIRNYNKKPTVVFPKLNLSNDPNEGNRVKMAMRDLKLLNKLIALTEGIRKTDDHDKQQELLEDFIASCKYIMKSVSPQIGDETIDTNLGKLFKDLKLIDNDQGFSLQEMSVKDVQAIQTALAVMDTTKIGELFNDLFDFKCSIVQETGDSQKNGKKVSNGTKIALMTPLDCLYQVTARHEDLMLIAFKNLTFLPPKAQLGIINDFHDRIMAEEAVPGNKHNGQGWQDWQGLELLDGDSSTSMTKELLDRGVEQYTKIKISAEQQRLTKLSGYNP